MKCCSSMKWRKILFHLLFMFALSACFSDWSTTPHDKFELHAILSLLKVIEKSFCTCNNVITCKCNTICQIYEGRWNKNLHWVLAFSFLGMFHRLADGVHNCIRSHQAQVVMIGLVLAKFWMSDAIYEIALNWSSAWVNCEMKLNRLITFDWNSIVE